MISEESQSCCGAEHGAMLNYGVHLCDFSSLKTIKKWPASFARVCNRKATRSLSVGTSFEVRLPLHIKKI